MTTGLLALIIASAILAQVTAIVVVAAIRSRRRSKGIGELIGDQPTSGILPLLSGNDDWVGYRQFVVSRRVLEDRAESVCSFYLAPVDGRPLPTFLPGQYLTFKLPIGEDSETVVRCYSLSERPRPDYYRIMVKRVPPPDEQPHLPPGRASSYLHTHAGEGALLDIRAPRGRFTLTKESHKPVVLIAGGIGITPLLSMLNTALNSPCPPDMWLFYSVRCGAEHVMKEHLGTLEKAHPCFHLHVVYSRPDPEDVEGVDYDHHGRIGIELLRDILGTPDHAFYVCGPRSMLESLVPALRAWGADERDIHYESFGPASLEKRVTSPTANQGLAMNAVTVTFSRSGQSVAWDPDADSLLTFAEDNGIEVMSGCRAGSCGSCETQVEDGVVVYDQLPDADIQPGHCLLCVGRPGSDLTLAA